MANEPRFASVPCDPRRQAQPVHQGSRTQPGSLVWRHSKLVSGWRRDAQPRTRLHHKDAFGRQQYSGVGCMIEATTTLTQRRFRPHRLLRDRHQHSLAIAITINILIVLVLFSQYSDMNRQPPVCTSLPAEVAATLIRLGQRLHACRIAHNLSHRDMAERMMCSINTYRALEAGRPGCGIGNLACALWLLGQLDGVDALAQVPAELATGRRAGRKRSAIHELDF